MSACQQVSRCASSNFFGSKITSRFKNRASGMSQRQDIHLRPYTYAILYPKIVLSMRKPSNKANSWLSKHEGTRCVTLVLSWTKRTQS